MRCTCPRSLSSAAFGRLCVETFSPCVIFMVSASAAFGRLCVETAVVARNARGAICQPPSGGCVLKHEMKPEQLQVAASAAFGRLCVETHDRTTPSRAACQSAAFGRLCVETRSVCPRNGGRQAQPPSGGCVLKHGVCGIDFDCVSRLRAAVC